MSIVLGLCDQQFGVVTGDLCRSLCVESGVGDDAVDLRKVGKKSGAELAEFSRIHHQDFLDRNTQDGLFDLDLVQVGAAEPSLDADATCG